jgi:ribonuclease T2
MPKLRKLFGAMAGAALLSAAITASAYDNGKPHAFRHGEPGNVDYYVLMLGWSPTYCLQEGRKRGDMHCNSERSDEFVMHGYYWPQYDKGWPEDCYMGQRPWIPSA